uniref:E3 ubiquitin-protein ligase CHIP n=1 Tax=Panagrellus redivivus TaxID=6233 RepID=A0A7E4VP41_PANRE
MGNLPSSATTGSSSTSGPNSSSSSRRHYQPTSRRAPHMHPKTSKESMSSENYEAPKNVPTDPKPLTAKDFKEKGNRLFQAQRYDEAIIQYTSAIGKDNTDPTFLTNRALCYLQMKQSDKAEKDCRRAIEIEPKNIKGHYLLGKIWSQNGQYEDAIMALTRANEYAGTQKICYGDEITNLLRNARRERFRIDEQKRIAQEIELQSYLNGLIDADVEKTVTELRDKDSGNAIVEAEQNKGAVRKEFLNSLFNQIDERRRKREIPDYLCGKISFELLKDPVITPSGITYDRADIKEHLYRVGHFDPVTRVPLTEDKLIPNLAMKEVLENFIAENEWALDA